MTDLIRPDEPMLGVDELFVQVSGLIEEARLVASRQVNAILAASNWQIGQIVSTAILQNKRADYGKQIVATLSHKLTARYGKGYDESNLRRMVKFAQVFPEGIQATLSPELSWSHVRELLTLDSATARDFYIQQIIAEHLSVRELRGVIARKAFERREIANSQIEPGSAVPMDAFKDPYLLDFLGIKDEHSESDLEAAIIRELELFLLEFGRGFTFVERQKRIGFDGDDYYLDLLLYNRDLRRLIAVELKLGKFKPAHKGQMEFYLKWLDNYERKEGEEAPIGLLLVAKANREQLELLEMHKDGIVVAEYWTEVLPKQDLEARLAEIVRSAQERQARRGITATSLDPEDDDDDE